MTYAISWGLFNDPWSIGYAADLGTVPPDLLESFGAVDLLALEFNHDEQLQVRSGRPRQLIDRVLGDRGHLSNVQAAESVRTILNSAAKPNLRHLVQLHLSLECNRPNLAREAVRDVLAAFGRVIALHTAWQDRTTKLLEVDQ